VFRNMKMKRTGISEPHESMIHLLLLMSNNPTGGEFLLTSGQSASNLELSDVRYKTKKDHD